MINNIALFVTEVIIVISFIAMLISPIFFRDGGVIWGTITRRGIIVTSICFGILVCATWIAVSIDNPSHALTALICLSGGALIGSIYFVILYLRLPRIREKSLRLQYERQKTLRKDKDANGE